MVMRIDRYHPTADGGNNLENSIENQYAQKHVLPSAFRPYLEYQSSPRHGGKNIISTFYDRQYT